MSPIHVINTVTAAEKIVYRLLVEQPLVGLVCKGIDIGPQGGITLVIVSTPDGQVFIFDIRADQNIILNGGLVRLIESVDNIKVMHSSPIQATCLFSQFKVRLKHVFDVQEKYGDLMVSRGLPRRYLSLPDLLDRYNVDRYTPSTKLQKLLQEDRNVWSRRPLTKDMLNTAASDVLSLVPRLYVTLYRCLGLHQQQTDTDIPTMVSTEMEPATNGKKLLPVLQISSLNQLQLPTNYLHIHVTK